MLKKHLPGCTGNPDCACEGVTNCMDLLDAFQTHTYLVIDAGSGSTLVSTPPCDSPDPCSYFTGKFRVDIPAALSGFAYLMEGATCLITNFYSCCTDCVIDGDTGDCPFGTVPAGTLPGSYEIDYQLWIQESGGNLYLLQARVGYTVKLYKSDGVDQCVGYSVGQYEYRLEEPVTSCLDPASSPVLINLADVLAGSWTVTLNLTSAILPFCGHSSGPDTVCTGDPPASVTLTLGGSYDNSVDDCEETEGCDNDGFIYRLRPCGASDASTDVYICRQSATDFDVGDTILYEGICYNLISIDETAFCAFPETDAELFSADPCADTDINYCQPFCAAHSGGLAPLATITISGTTAHAGTTGCDTPCESFDGIYEVYSNTNYISDGGACTSTCSGVSFVIFPTDGEDCDCFSDFGVSGKLVISWCVEDAGGGNSTITVAITFLPVAGGVGTTFYSGTLPNGDCDNVNTTLTRTGAGACCDFPATIDIDFVITDTLGYCG